MDARQGAGDVGQRSMRYCVVPRDLAAKLHEYLRRAYAGDPLVTVVVERRNGERRGQARRAGTAVERRIERRRVHSVEGRRVADRRALTVEVAATELPRKARRHADELTFVERVLPTDQHAEDLNSQRLVVRFQSGDEGALNDLYLRYFDAIYSYARVALRDAHEAEDVTQQVFTRVVEALPRYEMRRGSPFRGWLFRIARNAVLDTMSKQRHVRLEDPATVDLRRERNGDETASVALRWLTDREVALFVERLPEIQRQVLVLRFMLDLSTDQIADILERNPKAVRKMQSRALQTLNARLAAVGRTSRADRAPVRVRMKNLPVLAERRFALAGSARSGPAFARRSQLRG